MVARGPYYAAKDAWVAQLVGGSTQYGNGTNLLITVGPAPNSVSGDPDFKGRGIFEISADNIASALADLTSVDAATMEVTVAGTSCIGSRGGTIRILLEEMTTDFGLKSASGDCKLGSGSGSSVWGISNNITTANRAFHSSGSHSTGDKLTFDVTAMLEARRAAGDYSALRFRLIAANSDGTGYAETTASRRITVYSMRHPTDENHANLTITGTIASTSVTLAETGAGTESLSISQSGTSPSFAETAVGVDGFTGGPAGAWRTVLNAENQGVGVVELPDSSITTLALLASVSEDELLARVKFRLDKVPSSGEVQFSLILRALDAHSYYRVAVTMNSQQSMGLVVSKVVADVSTVLATLADQRTLVADVDYWLEAQISGLTPAAILSRFWRVGDTEPGWDLAIQDSEASLQANGTLGLGASLSSVDNVPITIQFDDFEAVPV